MQQHIKINRPLRLLKQKDNIYSKVNNHKRVQLLHLVKEKGKSLKEASQILDINYSTAKTILRIYRIEKRILKKSSTILTSHTDSDLIDNNNGEELKERHELPLLMGMSSQASSSIETNYSLESPHKSKGYGNGDMCGYIYQLQHLVRMTQECVEQVIMNEMIINNISNSLGQLSYSQGSNAIGALQQGFGSAFCFNSNCIGGNSINHPIGGVNDLQ